VFEPLHGCQLPAKGPATLRIYLGVEQALPHLCGFAHTLNRHRGKGQQKVTVEHVHVHEGGQAIVGNVESRGDGSHRKRRNNPKHLPMHQAPRCRARTRRDSPCQSPAMKNGRCRMHGGPSPGAPKGNKNALKHGRYTAQAMERRPHRDCRAPDHACPKNNGVLEEQLVTAVTAAEAGSLVRCLGVPACFPAIFRPPPPI
jgi:hypothetical protein